MKDEELQKLIEEAIQDGWSQDDDGPVFFESIAVTAIMKVIAEHRPDDTH